MVAESVEQIHLLDNGNVVIGNLEMHDSQFDFRRENRFFIG